MNRPSEASENLEPQKKKAYESPKLLIYGNLAEMTQARGNRARNDGKKTGAKRRTG